MSRECNYCGKKPFSGNKVSHSNIKTRTRWLPNLHRMRAFIDGATKTVRVCARCVRSGRVVRPLKRTYRPEAVAAN